MGSCPVSTTCWLREFLTEGQPRWHARHLRHGCIRASPRRCLHSGSARLKASLTIRQTVRTIRPRTIERSVAQHRVIQAVGRLIFLYVMLGRPFAATVEAALAAIDIPYSRR